MRDFFDFVDMSKGQNANTYNIVEAMYAYFERQTIYINNFHIVAQSYGGVSVMSGNTNGCSS